MSSKSGLDGGIRPRFVGVIGKFAGRNGEKFEELVHGGLASLEGKGSGRGWRGQVDGLRLAEAHEDNPPRKVELMQFVLHQFERG